MKKVRGVSTQSIIIGAVIVGVIAASGLAYMWDSVEKSKINVVAETMDEQHAFLIKEAEVSFGNMRAAHLLGDGDEDYLDEVVGKGWVSKPPYDFFDGNVIWEIRMINEGGLYPLYYIHVNSDSESDLKLIKAAVDKRGYIDEKFMVIQP